MFWELGGLGMIAASGESECKFRLVELLATHALEQKTYLYNTLNACQSNGISNDTLPLPKYGGEMGAKTKRYQPVLE
jgi:hypothetical protein